MTTDQIQLLIFVGLYIVMGGFSFLSDYIDLKERSKKTKSNDS